MAAEALTGHCQAGEHFPRSEPLASANEYEAMRMNSLHEIEGNSPHSRWDGIHAFACDDNLVLYHKPSGRVLALSKTGGLIYEQRRMGFSIRAIAEGLSDSYGIPTDEAERDVRGCMEDMEARPGVCELHGRRVHVSFAPVHRRSSGSRVGLEDVDRSISATLLRLAERDSLIPP
jgi:hypothetical protein